MRPEKLKSLFHVLGELALPYPGLVLTKGRRYWLIGRLLDQARRALKGGSQAHKEELSVEEYWWEELPDRRVVVWRETGQGAEPFFAEVGSHVTAEED